MSERAKTPVTIRIWDGCTVVQVMDVGPTGFSVVGPVSGAMNSTQVDIELDPWGKLIVDNRKKHPRPVYITDDEPEQSK